MVRKKIRLNNKAVSQVVGFMVSFSIIILITGTSIYTVSFLIDQRVNYVSEITAESVVNYVTNTVIECSATIQTCKDVSYSKTIEVPVKIQERSYYIKAIPEEDKVYLNTIDDVIKVSSRTYNQDLIGIRVSGEAYSSTGFIRVYNEGENIYISTT
jgi:hypothetical protein